MMFTLTYGTKILMTMAAFLIALTGFAVKNRKPSGDGSYRYSLENRAVGRSIIAISSCAADMSPWILLGLPGLVYWSGLSDSFWIICGLLIGIMLVWLLIAEKIRGYSEITGKSATLPEFFNRRFKDGSKMVLTVSSVIAVVFYTVYVAACFSAMGKLLSAILGLQYSYMMELGGLLLLVFTVIAGFKSQCLTDFVQAVIIAFALFVIVFFGSGFNGGMAQVCSDLHVFPGFMDFLGIPVAELQDGVQKITADGMPVYTAAKFSIAALLCSFGLGLGYFGMPHMMTRFMSVNEKKELKGGAKISIIWTVVVLACSISAGFIAKIMYPAELLTRADSELAVITFIKNCFPGVMAGIVATGVMFAAISSVQSFMFESAYAVSHNIIGKAEGKTIANDRDDNISRITMVVMTIVAILIVFSSKTVIHDLVTFAWSGLGASFGPLVLFSLFWKKTTKEGALAGMISGAAVVVLLRSFRMFTGLLSGIYELLPAFIVSCIFIIIFSKKAGGPGADIEEEFDRMAD